MALSSFFRLDGQAIYTLSMVAPLHDV